MNTGSILSSAVRYGVDLFVCASRTTETIRISSLYTATVGSMFHGFDQTVAPCCDAAVGVSAGGGPLEVLHLGLNMSLES